MYLKKIDSVLCCLFSPSALTIIRAECGQDVILPCQVHKDYPTGAVVWRRTDLKREKVLLYQSKMSHRANKYPSSSSRLHLMDGWMDSGNLSLALQDVTQAENGTYECLAVDKERYQWKTHIENTDTINTIQLMIVPVGKFVESSTICSLWALCSLKSQLQLPWLRCSLGCWGSVSSSFTLCLDTSLHWIISNYYSLALFPSVSFVLSTSPHLSDGCAWFFSCHQTACLRGVGGALQDTWSIVLSVTAPWLFNLIKKEINIKENLKEYEGPWIKRLHTWGWGTRSYRTISVIMTYNYYTVVLNNLHSLLVLLGTPC